MSENVDQKPVNRKRLGFAIASGFALDVVNKISPLLILHHAQKFLGLAAFGGAQWMIAIVETMQPLVTFGYNNYAMAEISQSDSSPKTARQLLARVGLLKLIHLLVLFVLGWFWVMSGSNSTFTAGQLVIILLICFTFAIDAIWFGLFEHKLTHLNLAGGVIRVGTLVGVLVLVRVPDDLTLYLLLSLLPNAAISVATGFYAYRRLGLAKVQLAELFLAFKVSLPYGAVVLLYVLYDRFDLFLVGRLFSPEELGSYSGAAKIAQSLVMLTGSIVMAFYAENMQFKDPVSTRKHLSLNLWMLMSIAVPVTFGAPFVAHNLMNMLFPTTPDELQSIFWVLSSGFIGTVLITVFGLQLLLLRGRVIAMIVALSVGLLAGILLSFSLRDWLGVYACAWGVVAAKTIAGVIIVERGLRVVGQISWGSIFRPILAGVIMAIFLGILAPEGLWAITLTGGVAYLAAAVALNVEKTRYLLSRIGVLDRR